MDEEEKKHRFKSLFKQALDPLEEPPGGLKPLPTLAHKVIINGDWHHYAAAEPRVKVVVVMPPGAVISKAQKAALVGLRNDWVALHNTVKARQITRADARKALNDQAKVTAHRLIPADRYDDLVAWLSRQIARLPRRPSARIIAFPTHPEAGHPDPTHPRRANPWEDLTPAQRQQPEPHQVEPH